MVVNKCGAAKTKAFKSVILLIFILSTLIFPVSCVWTGSVVPTVEPPETEYLGMILNKEQKKIGHAEITLTFRGVPITVYSDEEGVYKFLVNMEQDKLPGQVRVEAKGYKTYSRNITLYKENLSIEEIQLDNDDLIEYSGYVYDETNGAEISDAKVTLKLGSKIQGIDHTDSAGFWRFEVSRQEDELLGVLFIDAPGYHSKNLKIKLTGDKDQGKIYIFPDSLPQPTTSTYIEIIDTTPTPSLTPTSTTSPSTPTSPPLPTPTLTPNPTATRLATSTVTIDPPTTAPPTPAVDIPTGPNFETFEVDSGVWTLGDQKNGTLVRSASQAKEGSYAGQITYEFTTTTNDYVVFLKTYQLAGQPTGITADVFGDGSGHYLNVWVKDSQGEIWSFTFGHIEHVGWQSMTAVIDSSLRWPNGHVEGPDNNVIDYPLTFYALVLDDAPDSQTGSGEIYVDNLAMTFDPLPSAETPTAAPTASQPVTPVPSETSRPVLSDLTGRIAFPVDRGGYYDIWLGDLTQFPNVTPFSAAKRARQPNFNKRDGQLLANGEDYEGDRNLRLYPSNFNSLTIVSESPSDAYPFWAPGGERLVYSRDDNDQIYVNCSLTRPSWETSANECNNEADGVIMTERNGHLIAEMPVWTQSGADLIVRWLEPASKTGLGRIGSWATNRDKDPIDPLPEPVSLLPSNTARPTDTFGDTVYFFASDLDGNWEVYALNIGGGTPVNLSNSPGSNDGLPTISPDGRWVAFVSDRDGRWAIWAVPAQGGTPQKLFDMPQANPWGQGTHDWITERISWGP